MNLHRTWSGLEIVLAIGVTSILLVFSRSTAVAANHNTNDGGVSLIRNKRASCLEKVSFSYNSLRKKVIIHENRLNDDDEVRNYKVSFNKIREELCSGDDFTVVKEEKKDIFTVPEEISGLTSICALAQRPIQPVGCKPVCATVSVGRLDIPLFVRHLAGHPDNQQIRITWMAQPEWFTECRLDFYMISVRDLKAGKEMAQEIEDKVNCHKNCTHTVKNLKSKNDYQISVTPYFLNNRSGDTEFITSRTRSNCTHQLKHLEVSRQDDVVTGNWNTAAGFKVDGYRVIVRQLGHELCGSTSPVSNLDVPNNYFRYKYESAFGLELCVEAVNKSGYAYCDVENRLCERVAPDNRFPLSVESLNSIPRDTSVELQWHIPQIWQESCNLLYFRLHQKEQATPFWPDGSTVIQPNDHCMHGLCSYTFTNLKENTLYNYLLKSSFEGGTVGEESAIRVKTYNKLPVSPGILEINAVEKNVLARFEDAGGNNYSSCNMYADSPHTNYSRRYQCHSKRWTIKYDDLAPGGEYLVWIEVCNDDGGCSTSPKKTLWTPPDKIDVDVNQGIKLIETSLEEAKLKLPLPEKLQDNQEGLIYIVVSDSEAKARKLDRSSIIEVAKRSEQKVAGRDGGRGLRSYEGANVVMTLPMSYKEFVVHNFMKEKYYTQKGSSKGGSYHQSEQEQEFWVSAVYKVKSGPYEEYEATDFYGPFKFQYWSGVNYTALAWAIGAMVVLILLIVVLFTLRSRRKAEVMLPLREQSTKGAAGKDNEGMTKE